MTPYRRPDPLGCDDVVTNPGEKAATLPARHMGLTGRDGRPFREADRLPGPLAMPRREGHTR